jgi:ribulose-5-phosphate 4-epimerase/fuculose-1-phosphate aldolase
MSLNEVGTELIDWCRYLAGRGLCPGASGNVSSRRNDGWVCTPTGRELGRIEPSDLAVMDRMGLRADGSPVPTKEWQLHLALYRVRPEVSAVVHLHSRYAVAASCRSNVNAADVIPALTSYYVMNVDRLPLVPWQPPGDPALARAVGESAHDSSTLLLANHGSVVGAQSLGLASHIAEEIEEAAAIWLALGELPCRALNREQIDRLRGRRTGEGGGNELGK